MKVLMLLDNPFFSDQRVERECFALVKEGYKVTIIAMMVNGKKDEEYKSNIKVYRILKPSLMEPFKRAYRNSKEESINEILKFDFDVLHCHDYHLLPLAMDIVNRKKNVKLIYDSHEYFAGWPVYRDVKGIMNKMKACMVWRWLLYCEKKIASKADGVLCTTGSICAVLKRRFGNVARFTFLRNIPTFPTPIKTNYLHEYFKLSLSTKILVHSGNIYLNIKEFRILVQAIKNTRNCVLVFIADPDKSLSFQNELTEESATKIFFHPYVPAYKLGELLASAHIGFLLVKHNWRSHRLTSPNRLMEYLISGIPVISNFNTEASELIKTYNCGLMLENYNERDIVEAITTIISKHEKFTGNAITARKSFSWDEERKKLIDLYRYIESK